MGNLDHSCWTSRLGVPRLLLFPQEYMDAMQTTLLNGCLPGGTSDKDHEWQDKVIASYLKALAELIATVLNPMTSDDDWPSWTDELSFLSDVEFWTTNLPQPGRRSRGLESRSADA